VIEPDGRPTRLTWNYDRTERIADSVVHVIGTTLALSGVVGLLVAARGSTAAVGLTPILVYAACLLTMLGLSAAYNMWPVSPAKWILRRFDHSAIYVLIAGTYTPFVAQMKSGFASIGLLLGVWCTAAVGVVLKLVLPGRFDRLSIALYLLMGWSGAIAYDAVAAALPPSSLRLLGLGGVLYSVGVVFHVWKGLRFQNAIWHTFVLLGAACHYTAVLETIFRYTT
jgi:hemolysin III